MNPQPNLYQTQRITFIGFIANLLLGIIKIAGGLLAHSQALLADGIHSLSDLLIDSLVFAAAYLGNQHPDQEHPYGHARIETVATIFIACLLLFTSAGIIYDAWWHIKQTSLMIPQTFAIAIALFSTLINEALFHATLHVALNTHSELLKVNAWHHRSDAASSIIVIIGIVGTLLGNVYLDAIAAVVIGLLIAKMAISLVFTSFRELIDTAVDKDTLNKIKLIISHVSGVNAIHQLRTRLMAGKIFIDVHVLVDSHLSVSEGHHIGQQVHHTLLQQIPLIQDVTVHIDPEDDETVAPSLHLPSRQHLLPKLHHAWRNLPGHKQIKNIGLHYLDGMVHVDVYLPIELAIQQQNVSAIIKDYEQAFKKEQFPLNVSVYFC